MLCILLKWAVKDPENSRDRWLFSKIGPVFLCRSYANIKPSDLNSKNSSIKWGVPLNKENCTKLKLYFFEYVNSSKYFDYKNFNQKLHHVKYCNEKRKQKFY